MCFSLVQNKKKTIKVMCNFCFSLFQVKVPKRRKKNKQGKKVRLIVQEPPFSVFFLLFCYFICLFFLLFFFYLFVFLLQFTDSVAHIYIFNMFLCTFGKKRKSQGFFFLTFKLNPINMHQTMHLRPLHYKV